MKMKKYLWMCLAFFFVMGCESLEDTYSDYSGDGVIHYVGQCTDVTVSPGWRRLIVTWKNSVDPSIANIKVLWTLNGVTRDTVLEKGVAECSIPNLEDGNYEIQVCAVDQRDSTSFSIPKFGRPYTSAHETILSFTRLIAKHYFVNDRLVLFFSNWDPKLTSATLEYYIPGESALKTFALDSTLLATNPYYLLPDAIDSSKPVVMYREGRVEGCEDLIPFDPYELGHEKLFTTDFRQWVKEKYGEREISEAWVNSQTELEYDYSITSFEDILNFPALEKIVLGKTRYLNPEKEDIVTLAELYDRERSLFVLDVMNEVYGVQVEQYSKHFFTEEKTYVTSLNTSEVPQLDCYDASDWKITCSEEDKGDFNSRLDDLFNGNVTDYWQPELGPIALTYEISVDMITAQMVNGVKVVQKSFASGDVQSSDLMPNMIKVQYSADEISWHDATHVEENTLGATNGETTILYFATPREVRYLKFIVSGQVHGQNFSVSLAEIGVF
ncbi:DUF4998 domain-containing protein [Butyricimonas sp.]|uniref:DUF4998 domain-containing protein n=1 Tax=Butyricimonas sp. TaxID=1969738 RepID=UPI0025B7D4B4|nr:DUF4998 domain-containing protein [Butyricimonas sp.]